MRPILLIIACVVLLPGSAAAEAKAETDVEASTDTAREVKELYGGLKYRDPFVELKGGGGGAVTGAPVKEYDVEEDFSIHVLQLKGIMEDRNGTFALFIEPDFKLGFILKKGPRGNYQLEDYRGNPVPGVRGTINITQKTVILKTPDGDTQPFHLGEDDDEDEEDEEEPEDEE